MVHGNELLYELDPSYPTRQNFKLGKHTLDRILGILGQPFTGKPAGWDAPPGVDTAVDLFVGYLLLDALIGNVDRHHENWAIIELTADPGRTRRAESAPTFDHASSLGRELSDARRIYKVGSGRTDQILPGYVARAQSKIYARETDAKPVTPLDTYRLATRRRPIASRVWRSGSEACHRQLSGAAAIRSQPTLMSGASRNFVQSLLRWNSDAIQTIG